MDQGKAGHQIDTSPSSYFGSDQLATNSYREHQCRNDFQTADTLKDAL